MSLLLITGPAPLTKAGAQAVVLYVVCIIAVSAMCWAYAKYKEQHSWGYDAASWAFVGALGTALGLPFLALTIYAFS